MPQIVLFCIAVLMVAVGTVVAFADMTVLPRPSLAVDCRQANMTVINRSNRSVRVLRLRWLGSEDTSWHQRAIDSGVIATGQEWEISFCVPKIKEPPMFISIGYAISTDLSNDTWSFGHQGSQILVPATSSPVTIRLEIARRNLNRP